MLTVICISPLVICFLGELGIALECAEGKLPATHARCTYAREIQMLLRLMFVLGCFLAFFIAGEEHALLANRRPASLFALWIPAMTSAPLLGFLNDDGSVFGLCRDFVTWLTIAMVRALNSAQQMPDVFKT